VISPVKDRSVPVRLSRDAVQSSNKKLLMLAGFVLAGALEFWILGDKISFEYLASREADLRLWQANAPWITGIIATAIYVFVAGLSLPGAAVLTLACGWFFGFWHGVLVASCGSTGGAMVAFLLSRYFFRDWVQDAMQQRLGAINDAFEREGAFYLFTLRLVPVIPFFAINAIMGLTQIRARTYWWVSQLGMLPGTAAYVYAGSTVPSLKLLAEQGVGQVLSVRMVIAFAVLGILPLVLKKSLELGRRNGDHTAVQIKTNG
jgi:uncharacterized membrane protein YdjX (TVP38/TMEM64 family)